MKFLVYSGMVLCLLSSCETDLSNQPTTLATVRLDSSTAATVNSAFTSITAKAYGNVLTSGKLEVERGVVWDDTMDSPTYEDADRIIKDATKGTGLYTATMAGLPPAQTVRFRLYAKNQMGVNYSETKTVLTPNSKPVLAISPVVDFKDTTANVVATLSYTGGSNVTSKGICIGTVSSPSITNSTRIDAADFNVGGYILTANGLLKNKKYFVRAFAENELGINYSSAVSFTTKP